VELFVELVVDAVLVELVVLPAELLVPALDVELALELVVAGCQ